MESTKGKKQLINQQKPHAIIVALPLQGHVIPTVQLALKLASKGFSITFINAENIHHRITTSAAASDGSIFSSVDVEYVTVSDGLPLEYDRSLNHDRWVAAYIHCFPAHIELAIQNILKCRPSDRCCLIADGFSAWASDMANKFGLVYVAFWTEAALVFDIYIHLHLLRQNGHLGPPGAHKSPIEYIPGVKSIEWKDLMSYLQEEDLTSMSHQAIFKGLQDSKRADFVLCNTIQELEEEPISAIQGEVPFYAIGPLITSGFHKSPVATSLWTESDCTQWLSSKPPGSVLYVSFGSYAHIRKEDLLEIANGIKLSGVNFLWVLRPDMVSSNDPEPLPSEFKEEVQGRGMVVTWTSQTEVLCNKAIGGFLTHCGWNSVLESVWWEVPMLCFPLLTDQLTNRKLLVEEWKIGCDLCDDKNLLTTKEVSKKIIDLISGKTGSALRENMKRIKQIVENARQAQGSSERNIDDFIKKLTVTFEKKCTIPLDSL